MLVYSFLQDRAQLPGKIHEAQSMRGLGSEVLRNQVRLEHMLRRGRVLAEAGATGRPTRVLDHLWVAGAVEAASYHVLRHIGVSHVLNATPDLPLPPRSASFLYVFIASSVLAV